ncbi:pseudaminic acid synthase [Halobacillus salinarum]|uniref:Pseudaminic acid synthase n=1 Tax=Halobacillus salinarum TaxID=2932257 RepID=A0ABY4EJH4_9BACI|nr:pseudaminic acid synthase [Halobacillus salinarum]UOQ44120.1 pseudaminic acid synthase [Halobacillus salinarum]
MDTIKVGDQYIGTAYPPFIVAEMSGNHNQSLERALQIVETAAKCGVHGLKVQTFTAETMTLDCPQEDFFIRDPKSLWNGESLYNLYQQSQLPWEWHQAIFDKCKELGIVGFSTPFDETAVDFLETLDVPCYKIASFENTDLPLLRKVARTGKPVILSTGMATLTELAESVQTLKAAGCDKLILLKCTSTYPATPENTNINTIPNLTQTFACQAGLSDHTLGTGVAVASVALGATFIEKHFTLSRKEESVDAAFSMEPDEMKNLVIDTHNAWQSLGSIVYGSTKREIPSEQFRRSIYVSKNVKAGTRLTKEHIKVIRPGYGLPSKYYELLLGKKTVVDLKKGTAMKWEYVLGS